MCSGCCGGSRGLGPPSPGATTGESDRVAVLETNVDDLNPEVLGHFTGRALAAGALDVFHTAVQMKKGRPGTLLTVLCGVEDADRLAVLMLTETSAFGVRRTVAERWKLRREFREVTTAQGPVRVKLGWLDGRVVQAAPEFESCRAAAEAAAVPLKLVYEAALRALNLPARGGGG
ncbi:MAG: LarC family nickel insertion protein [Verrucomicrobia bacterium]|nr:LarC family nickel insertion protein [Verrucomicrobiota bacterium]